MSESLTHRPPVETQAVAVAQEIQVLPRDGQEVIVFQPDTAINLPVDLTGARIEHNMIKADRPVRVGETLSADKRAAIIAAEDARLAEVRAAFSSITSEPTPVATPIVAR